MKKKHVYISICLFFLLQIILFFLIFNLLQYERPQITLELSSNAMEYKVNNNNLLGLKRIIIEDEKYIYEFSSNKFFTKKRVNQINNSEYTSIIGLFEDKKKDEYKEISIPNFKLYNSGFNTYLIINSKMDNYEYTGIHLYYDKDKRISIRYNQEPVVSRATLDYDRNILNQVSQKYINEKWSKRTKFSAPISYSR